MAQIIYGNFSEEQISLFDKFNENVTDPVHELVFHHDHASFEEIQKKIPNISIDRRDWTSSALYSQRRGREEIRSWINETEEEFSPPFDHEHYKDKRPYFQARYRLAAMVQYLCVMVDSSNGARDWCSELEELPCSIGHHPYDDNSYRCARTFFGPLNHFETDKRTTTGHSTGFAICGAMPEIDRLALGELDIIASWALALSFRAAKEGFHKWTMNVVTAWSNTCRLIVAEVDFRQIKLALHVADPIQIDSFARDTKEIEMILSWMFPIVGGSLKNPLPIEEELAKGGMN